MNLRKDHSHHPSYTTRLTPPFTIHVNDLRWVLGCWGALLRLPRLGIRLATCHGVSSALPGGGCQCSTLFDIALYFSPLVLACVKLVLRNGKAQLSAMDTSARTPMKGAANCDKHCELQNSVNQQNLERILRSRDMPESMPASVSSVLSPGILDLLLGRGVACVSDVLLSRSCRERLLDTWSPSAVAALLAFSCVMCLCPASQRAGAPSCRSCSSIASSTT